MVRKPSISVIRSWQISCDIRKWPYLEVDCRFSFTAFLMPFWKAKQFEQCSPKILTPWKKLSTLKCSQKVNKYLLQLTDVQAKSHPRRGTGGGVVDSHWVFVTLRYFEKISPLVESLWFAGQDEVHIMVFGAAGDLCRHPRWSPLWAPSWILPKIRNRQKTLKIGHFSCWTCRIWHNSTLRCFLLTVFAFLT